MKPIVVKVRVPTMSESHPILSQEIVDTLPYAGCFLCRLSQQKSQRYIETLLDTAVIDVPKRDRWRQAKGLCQRHAHMALELPQSSSSLAILYEDVLRHEMSDLARLTRHKPTVRRWSMWSGQTFKVQVKRWLQAWQKPRVCSVCDLWLDQEQLYLTALLEAADEAEFMQAFTQSDGLCLPHLVRLMRHGSAHTHLPLILAAQQAHLEDLHDDLCEFIRKQDYRAMREPYGREADAWRRVVALLTGERGTPDIRRRRDSI